MGKIAIYTDGKSGWLQTPQGNMALPAPLLKQAQEEMFRELLHVILADRDSAAQVNGIAEDTVEISSAGHVVKIRFDAATGLPEREIFEEAGPAGTAEVQEIYSDWREAGGLKVPFKIVAEQGGKPLRETVVADYKFNTGLAAEDLSKKP